MVPVLQRFLDLFLSDNLTHRSAVALPWVFLNTSYKEFVLLPAWKVHSGVQTSDYRGTVRQ